MDCATVVATVVASRGLKIISNIYRKINSNPARKMNNLHLNSEHPPTPTHDDTVEEASLLLTRGTTAPSFSFGPKTTMVPLRAKIATTACVVLGTLTVLSGGRGSSSSHTRSGGLSADLLRGYDPSYDFCFTDNDTLGKYCWYPTDRFPSWNWEGVTGRGKNDCGPQCIVPVLYDPSQDFCYKDKDNVGKYCWYPTDNFPCGNWKGEGGRGYNDCGPKCTTVYKYDPSQDFCFNVLRTQIILANSAGTNLTGFRGGIGKMSLVKTIMIVVHSVFINGKINKSLTVKQRRQGENNNNSSGSNRATVSPIITILIIILVNHPSFLSIIIVIVVLFSFTLST